MRVDIITIFPDMYPGPLGQGIVGRALERGLLHVATHDLRTYAEPPHRQVDDQPFGGGGGMVLKPEPVFEAVEDVQRRLQDAGICGGPVILLSPQGETLRQGTVGRLAGFAQMTLICGRYEGVDERVRERLVDMEISIGDYILTGGEVAAMVLIEGIARLLPGALGDPGSAVHESFTDGLLDFPHYTRPAEYRGMRVPAVLRSGNHEAIRRWRRQQALLATARKRPDLLAEVSMSAEDRLLLAEARGVEEGDNHDS